MTKSMGSAGAAKATGGPATIESVADIIERELQNVIVDWLARVEEEPDLKSIPLSFEERRKQGYTVAMAVQESRLLQVTIFATLHKNTHNLEFSKLLPDVVTIADEVDAQMREQRKHFKAADVAEKAKGK